MTSSLAKIPNDALVVRGGQNRPEDIMNKPRIYVDFHNADPQGRLCLNCMGTIEDLARQQVMLQAGQALLLYSEDLEVEGVVTFSTEEKVWVAVIDWDDIHEVTGEDHMLPVVAD